MNIPLLPSLVRDRRLAFLLVAIALGAPWGAAAQDTAAPAGGASGTAAPASATPADTGGTASASGTTSASGDAGGTTTTTTTATAHTSSEGASGTASPAGHPHAHSAPAGAGVGEEPEPPCTDAPTFDPSTPRFELQAGGGGGVFFLTWRQSADSFMAQPMGAPAEGLYSGGLVRGEVAFAFGGVSLSAIYTHLFLNRDGGVPAAGLRGSTELGLLSGEIGVQCACRGSMYVWSFGIEIGGDVINGARSTIFASIEHRSMFYIWEGLFAGFDIDIATFIGMSMGGPSGGGILGSVFLGYSLG